MARFAVVLGATVTLGATACASVLGIDPGRERETSSAIGGAGGAGGAGVAGAGADGGGGGGGGAEGGSAPLTYPELVMSHEPIAYWRFDDVAGSNTAINEVANAPEGTVNGGATFGVNGLITDGTAMAVDGMGDFVEVEGAPFYFEQASSFTVEAWVNATPLGVNQGIAQISPMWSLRIASSDEPRFTRDSPLTGPYGLEDVVAGETLHVVGVYDANAPEDDNLCLFIDGEPQNCVAHVPVSMPMPGNELYIGTLGFGFGDLTGVIDEVAIYPHALTADEIAEHHKRGSGG